MSESPSAPTTTPEARTFEATPSGTRSGALLGGATVVAIAANYIFLLAAGRILGAEDYGALAALLGLLAVVLLPAAALQMAVSREISRLLAHGAIAEADAFARATLRLALFATLPLFAIAVALSAPLAGLLNIESAGMVALALTTLATTLVFPVAIGILQGSQRFHGLAVMYMFPWVLRLGLLAVLAAAGYRLGGAVLATVLSTVGGTLLAVFLVHEPLRRASGHGRPDLAGFLRYLGPVAVGLVGIALLTHVDILVVKARFSGDLPGAYGAASAFARVAFFVPATILAVLFPRTAARHARGEETEDILGRSLLATAAFCGALALFYAAAGIGLVATTFGADFAEGGKVLAPFALAIGLYSLAHVLVGYHLSRGETRYAWIVAAGVVLQVLALTLVPAKLENIVWANVGVAGGLIVSHELLVGSSVPAIRAGLGRLRGAADAARAVLPETLVVLLGATAFVCALFGPVVIHMGSTIVGSLGSDSTGSVAWFWQARHESGFHLLGTTHHTLSGAPFGWDQTNALNIQVLLPYYPTYLAAHVVGDVAAYNLAVLSGYVLSGATMYAVVRYLGCARLVSAWAALAYIVFPWHVARAEHASLLHLEVFPLLFLALVALVRKPSWTRFGFVAVANLACWLMSGYFGPMAAVTTGAFVLGAALTSERRRRMLLVLGSMGCAFAAVAVLGIAAVASNTNAGAGLERSVEDLSALGLRPLELIVPPAENRALGSSLDSFWAGRLHGSNPTETANYLGLLTIALAIGWLVVAVQRRRRLDEVRRVATAGLVATFVAGFAFALPSPINVFGQDVWMPSRLLWEVLPAFRVPSRWGPLLMAALVPLAALGLQASLSVLAQSRRRLIIAAAVVGAAMVFSFFELSLTSPRHFRTEPVPPEYAALDRTPRGLLAEYPLGNSDVFRFWQRRHGRPLVNGAPSDTPADYARLMLLDPAQPGTAENLRLLGVTAIGIHPRAVVDTEVTPQEPVGVDGYRLAGRFPDGSSMWQVVASPAPALVTLPGGFAKPKRLDDGFVGYAFVSPAGVGTIAFDTASQEVVRLVFDAVPPNGQQRVLRLANAEGEQAFTLQGRTRVSALVEIPRGSSNLLVKTDPPPASEADAIVLVAPHAEHAQGKPVLRAELVSAEPRFRPFRL